MSGVFQALINVIIVVLNMIQVLIFLSVIISWVNADPRNPLVGMVRSLTEPMYAPIKRHLTGRLSLPVDLSPVVLLLFIYFIKEVIRIQF